MSFRYFKVGGRREHQKILREQVREEDELERLMPAQFLPDKELTPGQKLCLGILQEAYTCLRGYSSDMPDGTGWEVFWRRRYRSMREAEQWVEDNCPNLPLSLTFLRCCEVLGFDPQQVRFAMLFRRKINPRLIHYIATCKWGHETREEQVHAR